MLILTAVCAKNNAVCLWKLQRKQHEQAGDHAPEERKLWRWPAGRRDERVQEKGDQCEEPAHSVAKRHPNRPIRVWHELS